MADRDFYYKLIEINPKGEISVCFETADRSYDKKPPLHTIKGLANYMVRTAKSTFSEDVCEEVLRYQKIHDFVFRKKGKGCQLLVPFSPSEKAELQEEIIKALGGRQDSRK